MKFGITLDQYQEMFKKQNGRCAICTEPQSKRKLAFSVDHDHKTKQIRDLLCGQCNVAIGMFQENIEILEKAIQYLKKHGH